MRNILKYWTSVEDEEVGKKRRLKLGHSFYGPAFSKIYNSMGMWFNIYNTNIVEVVENYFWTVHYKTIKWCINEKVDLSSFPLIKLCFWALNARLHMLSLVQSSLFTRLSQRTSSQTWELTGALSLSNITAGSAYHWYHR